MNDDELWAAIDAQRVRTVKLLEDLTPPEWDHASLCDGWRVRDVAAHLTMQQMTLGDGLKGLLRHPGGINHVIHAAAVSDANRRPTEELIAEISGTIGSRRSNVGLTPHLNPDPSRAASVPEGVDEHLPVHLVPVAGPIDPFCCLLPMVHESEVSAFGTGADDVVEPVVVELYRVDQQLRIQLLGPITLDERLEPRECATPPGVADIGVCPQRRPQASGPGHVPDGGTRAGEVEVDEGHCSVAPEDDVVEVRVVVADQRPGVGRGRRSRPAVRPRIEGGDRIMVAAEELRPRSARRHR